MFFMAFISSSEVENIHSFTSRVTLEAFDKNHLNLFTFYYI